MSMRIGLQRHEWACVVKKNHFPRNQYGRFHSAFVKWEYKKWRWKYKKKESGKEMDKSDNSRTRGGGWVILHYGRWKPSLCWASDMEILTFNLGPLSRPLEVGVMVMAIGALVTSLTAGIHGLSYGIWPACQTPAALGRYGPRSPGGSFAADLC